MKTLTIITTTYNRAYCIGQVYESLKRQNCDDFCWLVVDDGSTDNTREVIEQFKTEGIVEIEYIYQLNKGMTGARNTAYAACKTELNTIIDSDDWLADGAVKRIIDFWTANKREDIAGIIALDIDPSGKVIGDYLPTDIMEASYLELFDKQDLKGDKKMIYRTDLSSLFPYPEFSGENFYPASFKFMQIDRTHNLLILPEPVCVVDYNDDSMSFDKVAQYKRCPRGFAMHFNYAMSYYSTSKKIVKTCLMYIACSRLANERNIIRKSTRPFLTTLLYIPGIALEKYLLHTKRKALSVPKKH